MKGPSTFLRELLQSLQSRFVLLIGDDGAILIYVEKGIVRRRLFAPTPDRQHTKSFTDVIAEFPHAPIYVLIDVMDQSYVRHSFPPVSSLGLSKIVQRRLERDCAKEDIKGALNLGRDLKGRKDWNFLLISLANTKELQSWLDLVIDMPNRFAGVFLLPVECEHIIASLDQALGALENDGSASRKKNSPGFVARLKQSVEAMLPKKKPSSSAIPAISRWQILVSHNKVGGYRQVVLRDGGIVFTRLTQASDGSPELQAGNVEQELQNTIEYLKRLGYGEQSVLSIYAIVAQEVKNSIAPRKFATKALHLLTPHESAELLGLKQAVLSGDRFGDMVLASQFGAQGKTRLKLNFPYGVRLEKLYLSMKAVYGIALIGLLGLMGFILYDLALLPGQIGDIGDSTRKHDTLQKNLDKLHSSADSLHANADQVNDLVSLHGMLTAPSPLPLDMVTKLQPLVDDDHLLKEFAWKTVNPSGPLFIDKNNGANASTPGTTPLPAATAAHTGAASNDTVTTAQWRMAVLYHGGNWDEFLKRNDAFFDALQKGFPAYKLTHTALPGQTEDSDKLSVNFAEEAAREKTSDKDQSYEVTIDVGAAPPPPTHAASPAPAPDSRLGRPAP